MSFYVLKLANGHYIDDEGGLTSKLGGARVFDKPPPDDAFTYNAQPKEVLVQATKLRFPEGALNIGGAYAEFARMFNRFKEGGCTSEDLDALAAASASLAGARRRERITAEFGMVDLMQRGNGND